ncbi:MAG: trigger factor [Bacteroidota bacterium]
MPKIVREDVDALNAVLKVSLEKGDYEGKLKSELNKYRKKAHMKGFRKGKTPIGLVKKMYGNAVLADVINELLQSSLNNYMTEEKLNILGQPLASADQEELDFDINELNDFNFSFDLGLAPEFELEGLTTDNSFERYAVTVDEAMIDEDMANIRKRGGEQGEVEDEIVEGDMVELNADELDGDQIKENGWATTFKVLVDAKTATERFREEVLGKTKGSKIRIDINEVEVDRDETYVQKYLLNVEEGDDPTEIGSQFEATINSVTRVIPAELNEEFFKKAFGEDSNVKTEEEARAKIEEEIVKYYDRQAENLLFRDFQKDLIEKNPLSLPDAFLKRWLKASNDTVSEEVIEKEYESFAENLKWSLVRGKMVKKFDLKVGEEEIFEGFKNRVRQYFGGYGDELVILNTANRLMEDGKQVDQMYQELISERLFTAIREVVGIEDKSIGSKEFDEVIKDARSEVEQVNPPTDTDSTESTEEEEVTEDVG